MMARASAFAERLARAREGRVAERVGRRFADVIGEGSVEIDGGEVRLSGKGLLRRWLTDPRLRFARDGGQ
jgi:hypothetical protein